MGKLRTAGGYDFGEILSALQKCIRRGLEQEAMHWAIEFLRPLSHNNATFQNALWKRLTIITHEDIGIANPFAIVFLEACKKQFFEFWDNGDYADCLMVLGNFILFICRGKKTRIGDHFWTVMMQDRLQNGVEYDIPDFAYDKHTSKGASMKRGWKHWKEEGCKLENQAEVYDPYEEKAFELWPTAKPLDVGKPEKKET